MDEAKPFKIPKREVWEAFKNVKANHGAAGVDGQSIAEFEADLENNLYKCWGRFQAAMVSIALQPMELPSNMKAIIQSLLFTSEQAIADALHCRGETGPASAPF